MPYIPDSLISLLREEHQPEPHSTNAGNEEGHPVSSASGSSPNPSNKSPKSKLTIDVCGSTSNLPNQVEGSPTSLLYVQKEGYRFFDSFLIPDSYASFNIT